MSCGHGYYWVVPLDSGVFGARCGRGIAADQKEDECGKNCQKEGGTVMVVIEEVEKA